MCGCLLEEDEPFVVDHLKICRTDSGKEFEIDKIMSNGSESD